MPPYSILSTSLRLNYCHFVYSGVVNVNIEETPDGNITLTAYPYESESEAEETSEAKDDTTLNRLKHDKVHLYQLIKTKTSHLDSSKVDLNNCFQSSVKSEVIICFDFDSFLNLFNKIC